MPLGHKYQKYICLVSTLCFMIGLNCGVIMKNNMCLLYEFDNYASGDTTVIERFGGMTRPQYMLSCVRNDSFAAFHFRRNDRNCELLGTVEGCMSHDITMGTIFVQLTKCVGTAPWKVISQTLEKLQWKDPRHIGDREVVRKNADRHVARILYQGIYLTGFIKDDNNELYVVDMNETRIHCSQFVQVLSCADSSDYTWLWYEIGEPILHLQLLVVMDKMEHPSMLPASRWSTGSQPIIMNTLNGSTYIGEIVMWQPEGF